MGFDETLNVSAHILWSDHLKRKNFGTQSLVLKQRFVRFNKVKTILAANMCACAVCG